MTTKMSKKFYDTLHETYFPLASSRKSRIGLERRTRCLAIIQDCQPRKVLEVGFEDPHLSESIARLPGTEYTGVDISEVSVRAAREVGLSAHAVDVSSEKLPFDDGDFDLVYAAEVMEHLFDPDFAIEEFSRVLKQDGKVLITTPNLASWYNRVILFLGLQPLHTEVSSEKVLGREFAALGQGNRPVGHLRLFTLRGLIDFLGIHGFRVLSLEGYPLELLARLWMLESALSKFTSLASGFIVLCERREELVR